MSKQEILANERPVADLLGQALRDAGFTDSPAFSEVLERNTVNLVLADRRAGLVARIRPAADFSLAGARRNLEHVTAAAAAGAPILTPVHRELLLFDVGQTAHAATLWPLAENRLVTPEEMAAVLRGIHDTPPPPGLPGYLELRHGSARRKLARLKERHGLPAAVLTECAALAEAAMSRLEELAAQAPRILLHGDGHPTNIVVFDGCPVGIDMDEISVGPLEADLSLTFLHAARYPGADPGAGDKLAAAYDRPYNEELLAAFVSSRTVSRVLNLTDHWDKPEAQANLLQRLDAIKRGGRFANLYKPESLSPFAPAKL